MIELAYIDDIDAINSIMCDASVNDDISCDFTKNKALEDIPEHLSFIGVYKEKSLSGFFLLVKNNQSTVEIHTCLLPSLRGKLAIEAGKQVLALLFSQYQKVISWVPEDNKKALIFSKLLGFQIEGMSKASIQKNGVMVGQYLVGLTKGEFICQ